MHTSELKESYYKDRNWESCTNYTRIEFFTNTSIDPLGSLLFSNKHLFVVFQKISTKTAKDLNLSGKALAYCFLVKREMSRIWKDSVSELGPSKSRTSSTFYCRRFNTINRLPLAVNFRMENHTLDSDVKSKSSFPYFWGVNLRKLVFT